MKGTALVERPEKKEPTEGKFEFATDFPFVRSVVDEDGAKALSEKLPSAAPKAQKGDAVLKGYANTWVMDRDFEFVSRHAFDKTLEAYLLKNPIILLQHNHDWPLGQVADAGTDDTGLAVEGYVRKPIKGEDPSWKHGAYNDIIAGIYRTFSIGGYFYREIVDGEILITEIDLFEISVVAVPSNPDSIFEAGMKSIKGLSMRSTAGKQIAQMAQLLGLEPITDPALITLDDTGKMAHYHALAADFVKAHGKAAPAFDEWAKLNEELTAALGADDATKAAALAKRAEMIVNTLYGGDGETSKAGRVLSKTNESKLRKAAENVLAAADSIKEILDQLPEEQQS